MDYARKTAVTALVKVEGGGYSQLVLDSEIKAAGKRLTPKDVSFVTALFYGVLERKLTLDYAIAKYARHELNPTVFAILRISFFQLLYMDTVPQHAAVNEGVQLTKNLGQRSASAMINGILRSFLRDDCKIPELKGSDTKKLSIEYSCSEDFVKLFIDAYGREKAVEILAASMGRPPLYIRVNTLKTDADTLMEHLEKHDCHEVRRLLDKNCIELSKSPVQTVSHKRGFLHVQDYCSQQAALLLEAKAGERVLDVCAAPGSKSFVLAQTMENKGEIICCDLSSGRLELINHGAKRLGIENITAICNDGAVFNSELGSFDKVLCDVPCSGLGVLKRKPEIKYRDKKALVGLSDLQYKILETSSKYLKTGGVLVYSTCTLNPEENYEVLNKFLQNHSEFSPMPFEGEVFYKTNMPQDGLGDGFFISRIRRN